VDSIVRRLEPKRRLLPAADRGQLDLAEASCHNDPDGALRAVRGALESVPQSLYFTILGSVVALEQLRPEESLEILERLDVEKLGFSQSPLYRDWLGMTYHMLGDYHRELAVSGRTVALAGLGRAREAELDATRALPAQHTGDDPWPVPMGGECMALELQAHGYPEAARRVRERIIAWYGAAINDATRDDTPCMAAYFSVFYYTGRWDAARAGYEHRLAEDSTSIKAHAALGALAVRRGDKAEADRMEAWLAAHGGARTTRARARMAALRGDRQRAVDLLREAFEQRLAGRMFLHLDPDFASLRDFPAYRELLGPELKP
jgi:tetratricopeptide (TPR) repeat protein